MLNRLRRERGQDLVEYALVLPLLLGLLFGIIQFALILYSYTTIGDAARQAARYGVIGTHASTDTAGIRDAAYQVTDAAGLSRAKLTVTPTATAGTIQVAVTYTMDANLITWLTRKPNIILQAVSTKQIELE
jgi:Flp pilus assembly protein TadG